MARNRDIAESAFLIVVLAVAFLGWVLPGRTVVTNTSLGIWTSMPSALTELMGNTSYRGILHTGSSVGEAGIFVQLQVGCITPSTNAGAQLILQYANFTESTNTAGTFASLGLTVNIDNSANWPCPGNLVSGVAALPNINTNPASFIFRVMGQNGGGVGDNPRFSSVYVTINQLARRVVNLAIGSHGTSTFTYQSAVNYPVSSALTVTSLWTATNITGTGGCGFSTDHCWESGSSSSTINAGAANSATVTVTYAAAFTGTVEVVMTPTGATASITVPIGSISLLSAETLTV